MTGHPVIHDILRLWDSGLPVSQIARKVSLGRNEVSTIISRSAVGTMPIVSGAFRCGWAVKNC